jgi:TP901 family phage tail tape measure protein
MVIRAKDQATRVITALQRNVGSEFAHLQRHAAIANKETSLLADTIRGKYGAQILRQQKVLNGAIIQGNAVRAQGARQAIRNLRLMETGELQQVAAIRRTNRAQEIAIARQKEMAVAAATARRNTLRAVGAVAVVATVVAAAAAAAVFGLFKLANATKDYNQQIAYTLTQVDKEKTSVRDLRRISDDVAKSIAAPLEQLQPALYDIFSSMNVSVKQSRILLRAFAREAVAGQVDVRTAARSTIGIMNAFHIPVRKVNEVLDFQFQLVRKGVGTFSDFARTIGRSVPSAVRAGQSYQTLGGMLAFLTRNGLSAAMAAASAGRALDAISNPAVVKRLGDFGKTIADASGLSARKLRALGIDVNRTSIRVADSHGKFRPMVDIMREFSQVLLKLPPVARVAVLKELFKGAGGTIQARRFFDIVIKRFPEFNALIRDMGHASGATREAYDKMAGTVASRTELLKNRWKLIRNSFSDQLQPALQGVITLMFRATGAAEGFAKWFKGTLVPAVKNAAAIISRNVQPALDDLVKAWHENSGGIKVLAGDFGKLFAIAIPIAIVYLNYLIRGLTISIKILGSVGRAWEDLRHVIAVVAQFIGRWIGIIVDWFSQIPDRGTAVVNWFRTLPGRVMGALRALPGLLGRWATRSIDILLYSFAYSVGAVIRFFIMLPGRILRVLRAAPGWLVKTGHDILVGLALGLVRSWLAIASWFRGRPKATKSFFTTAKSWLITHGNNILLGLLSGLVNRWLGVKKWFGGIDDWFKNFFKSALNWLVGRGKQVLQGLLDGLHLKWEDVKKWFLGIPKWIKDHKGPLSIDRQLLVPAGKAIMGGFLTGLRRGAGGALGYVRGIVGSIWDTIYSSWNKNTGQWDPLLGFLGTGGLGGIHSVQGGRMRSAVKNWAESLRGWGHGSEWFALAQLISHESGFNPNAQNPTSTAFGLFQFLNGTWASTGIAKTSDPFRQTVAGLRYIASRYRDPIGAWSFWRRHHWYDLGGVIREAIVGVGLRSGRTYGFGGHGPERVTPIRTAESGSGGGGVAIINYNVNFSGPVYGANGTQLAQQVEASLGKSARGAGHRNIGTYLQTRMA